MALLEALLQNESGGRNIANVHQGTSSGQAQGYFQITTGTWDEFGGRQFAPTPMQATKEQQAIIAAKIPLKRWDESTVAKMRATGRPIDVNKTLGENLSMNGENIAGFNPRVSGPVEAAGGGAGSDVGATQLFTPLDDSIFAPSEEAGYIQPQAHRSLLADDLASSVGGRASGGVGSPPTDAIEPSGPLMFDFAKATPEAAPAMPEPDVTDQASSLADLFKVKDIGGARPDPRTGAPLIPRHRRTYG
jgi:hypothetical protein